jgi:hypothetical protein
MNNYSWLQKYLHKFALSSALIRELTFDVEKSLYLSNASNDLNHVFITGLARSGTTVLLNAIFQSEEFASLSYEDMPFALAPNIWKKVSGEKNHKVAHYRAHGDGIKISTNSPEAFEEVFWKTFESSTDKNELFKDYISLVLRKYNKRRYLSKNNQNIRRLNKIHEIFPESIILIPFREPLQHAYSLLTQHKKFIEKQQKDQFILNYMNWIGHSEFGLNYNCISTQGINYKDSMQLNHWIEQWYLTYKNILETYEKHNLCYLVCYESLCSDPDVYSKIQETIKIKNSVEYIFKLSSKEINHSYDEALLGKSRKIYSQLKKLSIS